MKCITMHCDADWGGSKDRKSTSEYLISCDGNILLWKSALQKTVTYSTEEAEFKSFATGISDLNWVIGLLKEMKYPIPYPLTCYTDNQACLKSLTNENYRGRSKHNEIHYNIVREEIKKHKLNVCYIASEENLAGIFTKILPPIKLNYLKEKLSLNVEFGG